MAKPRPELVDYYADVFAPLGAVAVDRLFGGWRYQLEGRAFAFFVGGGLYFRVGPGLRAELEARGSQPFSYAKRSGRVMITRFVSAPDTDLEDEDALRGWALRVLAEEPAGGSR
jgi:DNA transformation protein